MLRTYIKEDSFQETKLNVALESMLEQKKNQVRHIKKLYQNKVFFVPW